VGASPPRQRLASHRTRRRSPDLPLMELLGPGFTGPGDVPADSEGERHPSTRAPFRPDAARRRHPCDDAATAQPLALPGGPGPRHMRRRRNGAAAAAAIDGWGRRASSFAADRQLPRPGAMRVRRRAARHVGAGYRPRRRTRSMRLRPHRRLSAPDGAPVPCGSCCARGGGGMDVCPLGMEIERPKERRREERTRLAASRR
jgi:hypothetical protein